MDLNTIWFVLIVVLFVGYFILEGFDYGVGILLPFLGKSDEKRRLIINTIGPHWDGNEVWLLTAGGAMFAAFPNWYATLFSGFYLALFLMLVGLIVRGVAFEFRSKDENPLWRKFWDWMIFVGSFLPALLWGVAIANFVRGVPIDETMTYVGGFFNLLNWYALLGGLTTLSLFTFLGALFLTLKIDGEMLDNAKVCSQRLWLSTTVLAILFVVATFFETDITSKPVALILAVIALVVVLLANVFMRAGGYGKAFASTAAGVLFIVTAFFALLFPRVLISSLDPANNLTIYNASSTQYTLQIMLIVALIFVPIVLVYQGWSYWLFRKRLTSKSEMQY